MRKTKLFILLTFLLSIGLNSWAETETLFSYNAETQNDITYTSGSTVTTSCTQAKSGNKYGLKFDGDYHTMTIQFPTGTTFSNGDVISVKMYQAETSSPNNAYGFYLASTSSDPGAGTPSVSIPTSDEKNVTTKTYTVVNSDGFASNNKIYVTGFFPSSKKVMLQEIKVTRETIDTSSPTCTTTQTTESATVGTPLDLTVTPAHYTGLQWYKATASNLSDAATIAGATSATYSFTPAKADADKTYYFYCVATNTNSTTGITTAQSSTITVNVGSYAASTACKLYQAKYSNSFNAFIDESAKTISVYYLSGQSAPTVNSSSIEISDDATVDYSDATKIVVTAEDGTTKATYAVTRTAVTPFSGTIKQFNGTEDWVKTGNGYNSISNDKIYHAWVINRQRKDGDSRDTDARVALGKTRIYFFVDNATSVTLNNYAGSALSSDRDIKVYVNGTENTSITSMPAYNADGSASITIPTGAAAMIEISSNQKSGDTGWGKITVTGAQQNTEAISTLSGRNYASYVTWSKLDFANVGIASDVSAYIATGFNGEKDAIVLKKVNVVDAGTPIVVKTETAGATINVPISTSTASSVEGNALVAGDGTTAWNGTANYTYYYLASDLFHQATSGTLQKGKAYLKVLTSEVPISAPSAFRIIEEESNATNIEAVDATEDAVKFIENGKLYILRAGVVYDVLGRMVK